MSEGIQRLTWVDRLRFEKKVLKYRRMPAGLSRRPMSHSAARRDVPFSVRARPCRLGVKLIISRASSIDRHGSTERYGVALLRCVWRYLKYVPAVPSQPALAGGGELLSNLGDGRDQAAAV